MADDAVQVEEQEAEGAETPEQQPKGDAETKESERQSPAHNFDKGLSKLQRDFKASRRQLDELTELVRTSLASKTEPAREAGVEDAVDKFLDGRDADDVPTVADMRALVKQLGSQARGGADEATIAKAVQQAMEPLLKAKTDADERSYWAEFYRDHPTLDKDAVQRLWDEAAERGERRGQSDSDRQLATEIYFDELVSREEKRLKRQAKTPSTQSPTSSEGTQIAKEGASTQKAPADKPSKDTLYRALDVDGRL